MGRLLRRMHDLALPVDDRLPVHDVAAAAERSFRELADIADASFTEQAREMVDRIRSAPDAAGSSCTATATSRTSCGAAIR